ISYGAPNTTGYGAVGPRTRAAVASVASGSSNAGGTVGSTMNANAGNSQCSYFAMPKPAETCPQSGEWKPLMSGSCQTGWQCSTPVQAIQTQQIQSQFCTPLAAQTQVASCPTGQTGSITQTRTSSCAAGASTPTWSGWTNSASSCTAPTASCPTPWGTTVTHGGYVTAYQTSSVAAGSSCVSQTRTCTNGQLSGTYTYSTCTSAAATCTPLAAQTQIASCPTGQTGSITQTRTSSCTAGATSPTWSAWSNTANTCTQIQSNAIDVFLVAGQSNAVGYPGSSAGSPAVPTGKALQYYNGAISNANDPVGNAQFGSAWPAFGSAYYAAAGRRIAFVPTAVGGSGQLATSDTGTGNWSQTGSLFTSSTNKLDAAMTALGGAGYTPTFKGVLWSQGENDAIKINGGTVTANDYQAGLTSMIARYRARYGSAMPFYIFQTGTSPTESDAGYAAVRNAQAQVDTGDPLTWLVFGGAYGFANRGLMADTYHYKQTGYNEMGTTGAQNVVAGTSAAPTTVTCTPLSPETRTATCPAGQTGSITQTRTSSCAAGATSPTWSAWSNTANTCTTSAAQSCTAPWGAAVASGGSVIAYQSATVASGQQCSSETRTCTNGSLSGTYANATCTESSRSSQGAGGSFGMNDLFVIGNIMQYGFSGVLPPNSHAIPLSTTRSYLDSLAQSGVRSSREIVATDALADSSMYAPAGDVIKEYQARNFTLIIALGGPFPPQYLTGPNCYFNTDANWSTTATAMGTITANFFAYLKTRSDIDQGWLASRVIVEPFNEFDSLGKMSGGACSPGYGTPAYGARLYNAIKTAFAQRDVGNEVIAPSVVGYYFGALSETPAGDYDQSRIWLKDYYAAGGGGRANIHIYCDPTRCNLSDGAATASTIVNIYNNIRSGSSVGAMLTEFGIPVLEGSCSNGAMADAQRAILFKNLATSGISPYFWRLLPFDVQDGGCRYGLVPLSSWSQTPPSYDLTGQALFGTTVPPPPANLSASCNVAGTQVTLSWGASSGATLYPVRIKPFTTCPAGWAHQNPSDQTECDIDSNTATSVTVPVTAGIPYAWWVHGVNSSNWSGSAHAAFVCSGSGSANAASLNLASALSALQSALRVLFGY
ncbi:hypothetical protein A2680_00600, partial [Candidatus Kaiserbacteria bacterium RIFCSPHIGHO2_01_FULL_55_37]